MRVPLYRLKGAVGRKDASTLSESPEKPGEKVPRRKVGKRKGMTKPHQRKTWAD